MNNLIKQMQQPEFYPHAVKLPIQVIQTHISWIFLTGNYAYKLKKPVNFGFLDFSTLEKRKFFVEEELRLNQEIAPDIYLAILPICQQDHHYFLATEEKVVDYVLKMRQFPQESLLINLFNSGKLTTDLLKNLGKTVAKFHQNAQTNDYINQFGSVEIIKQSIEDNYQVTQKYIGIVQTEKQYQETKQFTDHFLQAKEDIFLQRIAEDKIRECHGDLHLKNICWWQNKIHLFDRIEFNEPFRFVDVIYDVAFTVMDLDARGKPDFGNIFLNSYLEQTGDWQGVEILPLYLCRQAYVRAKVSSFLLDDDDISPQDKHQAMTTAQDYYHLAWQYTQSPPGQIILMAGLSGSGKSTTAQKIAPTLNAIHIRSDAVRKHLAGIPLEVKAPPEIYSDDWTEKTYDKLRELGRLLAKEGFTVILDATYSRHQWRKAIIQQTKHNNLPLTIIHCDAPPEVLCDRLLKRKNDISDATPELILKQTFEPFREQEKTFVTRGEQLLKKLANN